MRKLMIFFTGALYICHISAFASPPLDRWFGSDFGIAPYSVSAEGTSADALVLDASERLLTAGTYYDDKWSVQSMFVARHTSDGGFDSSFGANGVVVLSSIAGYSSAAQTLGSDSQGRIVVAGSLTLPISCSSTHATTTYVAVVRIDEKGNPDSGFGSTFFPGFTLHQFGNCYDNIDVRIAIDSIDNVFVATEAYDSRSLLSVHVLKYRAEDGELDGTFGDHGGVTLTTAGDSIAAKALAIDQSNRILVGGNIGRNGVMFRLLKDGELDDSFGMNGRVDLDLDSDFPSGAGYNYLSSIVADTGGRVYVGGMLASQMFVARYTSSGQVDNSFAVKGIARTDFSPLVSYVSGIFLDKVGRINVLGSAQDKIYPANSVAVGARFNLDGTLNAADGSSGVFEQPFGLSGSRGVAGAFDSRGRATILVNGEDRKGALAALIRYDGVFADGFD